MHDELKGTFLFFNKQTWGNKHATLSETTSNT